MFTDGKSVSGKSFQSQLLVSSAAIRDEVIRELDQLADCRLLSAEYAVQGREPCFVLEKRQLFIIDRECGSDRICLESCTCTFTDAVKSPVAVDF